MLRYVVIGDPIDHSLSPVIHQAALDWNGISGTYGRRRVGPGEIGPVMAGLRSGELNGVNVTMPMKLEAAEAADSLTAAAQRIRAVNTLIPTGRDVQGHSTDIEGIAWAWSEMGWGSAEPALVLGSGGAAGAALVALEGRELYISARRPAKAQALLEQTGVDATVIDWATPVEAVVVNATPIGMVGNADRQAPHVIGAAIGWFDMVYGRETEALAAATARGVPACDGARMLVGQAAASFSAWTGVAPPHAVMMAALQGR
jgi:shikimate dehydrogenase